MFFGHVTQNTLKMGQNTTKYRYVTPNKGHVILILEERTPYGVPGLLRAPLGIRHFHAGCSVLRKK